jgi:hypothetical protein
MAYISSEHMTNKARDNMIAGEFDDFADNIMLANKLSFEGNYRSYLIAVNVPMSLLEETSGKLTTEQKKNIYDQALYYLNHIKAINPRSAAANYYMAKIQSMVPKSFLNDDMQSPEIYYKSALKLDPRHIGSRIGLAKLYKQQENGDQELATLEAGLQYYYNTSYAIDYYNYLTQLYLKRNDTKSLQSTLQKIRTLQKRIEKQRTQKTLALPWRSNIP